MSVKFENIDVLDALGKIMELHTKHYKEDFDLDKELIAKLAVSENTEDRPSLDVQTMRHLYPAGAGCLFAGQPRKQCLELLP